jgi:hypothetical protein
MFVGTHKLKKHLKNLPFGWIFLRKNRKQNDKFTQKGTRADQTPTNEILGY